MKGILGRKKGMTRVFSEGGVVEPVSVIEAGPCIVTQVKTRQANGYEAVQVGYEEAKRLNEPEEGHLKRLPPLRHLKEFRVDDLGDAQIGQRIDVSMFEAGDIVNISGVSKGKGFAGGMKRHPLQGRSQDPRAVGPGEGAGFGGRGHNSRQSVEGHQDGRAYG